jgi:hypothetical protein
MLSLSSAMSAEAAWPGEQSALLNDIDLVYAPGVRTPASAWSAARYVSAQESPHVVIHSLTLYPTLAALALANPKVRLSPGGATARQAAWLVELTNATSCSPSDGLVCLPAGWMVITDPAFALVARASS